MVREVTASGANELGLIQRTSGHANTGSKRIAITTRMTGPCGPLQCYSHPVVPALAVVSQQNRRTVVDPDNSVHGPIIVKIAKSDRAGDLPMLEEAAA